MLTLQKRTETQGSMMTHHRCSEAPRQGPPKFLMRGVSNPIRNEQDIIFKKPEWLPENASIARYVVPPRMNGDMLIWYVGTTHYRHVGPGKPDCNSDKNAWGAKIPPASRSRQNPANFFRQNDTKRGSFRYNIHFIAWLSTEKQPTAQSRLLSRKSSWSITMGGSVPVSENWSAARAQIGETATGAQPLKQKWVWGNQATKETRG